MTAVVTEPDYKSIVLKQREKSLKYYHDNKNSDMMNKRNTRQRVFYNDQKDYKIYNKYRRAKKLEKMDDFIDKNPEDYNMLINTGRVRALREAQLIPLPLLPLEE